MTSPLPSGLYERIIQATVQAIRAAEIYLPDDVKKRITDARNSEENPVAIAELDNIIENIRLAEKAQAPLCQDTGIPVLYLTLPPEVPFVAEVTDAVYEGVRQATESVPLRPNLVHPLTRHNTGDNTGLDMPPIHVRQGNVLSITVLPKGAGSENVSRLKMFTPSETGEIERFIVESVLSAGARPCPPVILGVGIGGTSDGAMASAKEALLEPVHTMTPEEQQICDMINRLGIGPMGLGGKTTCLAVKMKTTGCHTASLPVAVNVQCWAARRATVEVPV